MLFRPKYCANCGEKIERIEWGPLTSRRFCTVCEIELKGQEMIPRAIVIGGVLIGIFGFGSYLNSGTPKAADSDQPKQVRQLLDRNQKVAPKQEHIKTQPDAANRSPELASVVEPNQPLAGPPVPAKDPIQKAVTVEQGYFCGAETKKGTPCSRRVKGNVRCFQHPGMPAMVAAEKLRIN